VIRTSTTTRKTKYWSNFIFSKKKLIQFNKALKYFITVKKAPITRLLHAQIQQTSISRQKKNIHFPQPKTANHHLEKPEKFGRRTRRTAERY
jgi:hypothetical protein